jgi:Rod binding domain-containing protein
VRINQPTQPGPMAVPAPIDKESPLWQAAQGMEAQFMKEMLRNMRKTVEESPETQNNRALQIFRGMQDDQIAESAVRTQGIGLAELIVNQAMEMQRNAEAARNPVQIRELNKNDIVRE